ncbi:MAG: twin-arginine translocase TatA/TatE family subunit [Alphaproteobacteria bacterium]|nr:twin-arginine translocase TatA/TatE family subunit [Alphaproteobacteria bacterium]
MGFGSIWHWLVVLLIVLVLFGAGKIPRLMGDLAKGVKAFKSGLKDEDEKGAADAAAQPPAPAGATAQAAAAQPAAQPGQTVPPPQVAAATQAAPQPAGPTVRN